MPEPPLSVLFRVVGGALLVGLVASRGHAVLLQVLPDGYAWTGLVAVAAAVAAARFAPRARSVKRYVYRKVPRRDGAGAGAGARAVQGDNTILAETYSDASEALQQTVQSGESRVCEFCGDVVATSRIEAHGTRWCPALPNPSSDSDGS
ncbi:hypothetical protein DIPPA_15798 [Diplonema papillatum]|nr:hypothetical protein DIPPA_15798 [Diplonema papillatum]